MGALLHLTAHRIRSCVAPAVTAARAALMMAAAAWARAIAALMSTRQREMEGVFKGQLETQFFVAPIKILETASVAPLLAQWTNLKDVQNQTRNARRLEARRLCASFLARSQKGSLLSRIKRENLLSAKRKERRNAYASNGSSDKIFFILCLNNSSEYERQIYLHRSK